MKLRAPVLPLVITSPFGPRPAPAGPLHPGLDLRAQLGQEVYAAAAGVVRESRLSSNVPAGWRPGDPRPRVMGFGNVVVLEHGDGSRTYYCHLARRLVDLGQRVEAGQKVGLAGSTGYSFGPHLHFELRVAGVPVDPRPFLEDA